ncbi:MAG: hypothetical protein ACI8WB_001905 [Phenylobacterium sp.]|jgi:hypothetical protein
MKTSKMIPTTLLMTSIALSLTLTLSTSAFAHDDNHHHWDHHKSSHNECNLDLQNGVTISPEFVKVFDANKTLFQIQQDGQLTVDGKAVTLTAEQQQISAEYGEGLRKAVPDAVNVALDAMDMASEGVSTALSTLFGENSDIEYKVNGIIDKARGTINDNIERNGELYTIAPDSFKNLEEAFENDIEAEIEKVAMNSMGSIFSLLGDAMSSGSGNFEQRMEAFGEKMEAMGETMEQTFEAQGDKLEAKAEALCYQLKEIDKLETQLQQSVPQFANLELLDMDKEAE